MKEKIINYAVGFLVVLALAWAAIKLGSINKVLEFPFWAVILGIIVGTILHLPERLKVSAVGEFYIKLGLVFLGATVNFAAILNIGSKSVIQVLIGVPLVFFFTLLVAKKFNLDKKFGAVLATAVSICGVSAAIAAGSSISAKKEHLTYAVSLVILFALPFMFFQPYMAKLLDLSPAVAGSWIGNNIDNTAAVVGAGQLHSEGAMKVASIVKMTQNTLIGLVTFLLALWFAFKDRAEGASRPKLAEIWNRFPKFVLGFLLASALATAGIITSQITKDYMTPARTWLFAMAFVSIGLTVSFKSLKEVGRKPLYVFLIATAFNLVSAFILAELLFKNFTL